MDIIKVGILGVAAVFLAIPSRKEKQEYSMFFKHGSLYLHFYLYYHKGSDRVGICGEVRGDDRH